MTRDYREWHRAYDDPGSDLSWRLAAVRRHLAEELDARDGRVEVLSVCAGDGRDILGVLGERPDRERVRVTLVEIDPELAQRATTAAEAAGLAEFEVRMVDAGTTAAYVGAAPADIVLLVGVLGNVSDTDLDRTLAAAPQLCRPGALLLWSRGLDENRPDNDHIRATLTAAGFTELDYAESAPGDGAALGAMRYLGPPVSLPPDRRLFSFTR